MGFGWFNLVRDRDSKVRGPRARPGLVTLYQGRFVRTKVGPCVPGSARSLPACRSVFSFKQYIEIPVEISDVHCIFYGDTCCESNQNLFLVTEIFLILK